MDQTTEVSFMTENQETAPGSSFDGVYQIMDSNEIVVAVVPDTQSKCVKIETGNTNSKIQKDKNKEMTVPSSSERKSLKGKDVHPPSSNGVTEVVDTNENVVDVVPDMQSKRIKNKTENSKSKIQKGKNKEMIVASVPERKSLKRKKVHPPSSDGVTEVVGTNENVVDVMQSKRIKNKTGNAKSKIQTYKTKEMTVVSMSERENLKRKAPHPPTSEMVMDSIKVLKKRNGASFEDIGKYMEEKYSVNMKRLKYHAEKFLQKGVDNGLLEKIDRGGAKIRFKIKHSENIKKDSKNLAKKERKVKPEKKLASTKKQVKK